MDAPEDNFTENNVAGTIENSDNQKQEVEENVETGATEKRWPGWPGECVFRVLVPAHKVGGIIGRKGECIKRMCEESKARIKILDGPPGVPERVLLPESAYRTKLPESFQLFSMLEGCLAEFQQASFQIGSALEQLLQLCSSRCQFLL